MWRVEVFSNCILFFPKQITLFMFCILSGLSPPEHWATTARRKLQDTWWLSAPCRTKIYYCIAFMNTNTSFSNQWTNSRFLSEVYNMQAVETEPDPKSIEWFLSVFLRLGSDIYVFLKEVRLTALETISSVYPHNKHSTGRSMWS